MDKDKRRIGVYVCHCGGNISDFVDVKKVVQEIDKDAEVVVAKDLMFNCADTSQNEMIDDIKKQKIDRVVVAACSPKLHETTFRNMAKRAGLNPYVLYHANIREQSSWAHEHDKEGATSKALAHVRAAVAYVKESEPLDKITSKTIRSVLIIGGGVAGMRAAIDLLDMGVNVALVEKSSKLRGNAGEIGKIYPYFLKGSDIAKELEDQLRKEDNVTIFTNATVVSYSGYIGNFEVKVRTQPEGKEKPSEITLHVGSIIVATGFDSYKPPVGEYGYQTVKEVVTLPELAKVLQDLPENNSYLVVDGKRINRLAFIYCVGSRQKPLEEPTDTSKRVNQYCSRYCCNAATGHALTLHQRFKGLKIYHLYRDMRTYGRNELMYEDAGKNGSIFIRFDEDHPPKVSEAEDGCKLTIYSSILENQPFELMTDLVVLVTGMEPQKNDALNKALFLPVGGDGFYKEVHPKLRPVETNIMGLLISGTAQAPRDVKETLSSGAAAAAKAASFVLKEELELDPFVAFVDPKMCNASQACIKECPYGAIELITDAKSGKKRAHVNSAKCKGCGACIAVCPTAAIQLNGYTNEEIKSMIKGLAK